MTDDELRVLARWLWNGALALLVLALAGALVLIIALALGWNSPRPTAPPDWQAPGFPLSLALSPALSLETPSNGSGKTIVTLLDHLSGGFTLEVEAAPLSDPDSGFNGYGLVYRAQDAARYYVFAVGSDGYYAVLRVAGEEEAALVDWQQFPHVRRGRQSNRLRVTCAGPTCHFYINDEYTTTVEDTTWLAGDMGLWVRGFGDAGVVVQFASVSVWAER